MIWAAIAILWLIACLGAAWLWGRWLGAGKG